MISLPQVGGIKVHLCVVTASTLDHARQTSDSQHACLTVVESYKANVHNWWL